LGIIVQFVPLDHRVGVLPVRLVETLPHPDWGASSAPDPDRAADGVFLRASLSYRNRFWVSQSAQTGRLADSTPGPLM
jgi:hypothetical protein